MSPSTEHPTPLDWQDGQPISRHFGDVYFSRASGIDETRHVFLAGNRLQQRFAALPAGAALAIGETGFGTGLNFLCAWELFERSAAAGARLHFVSTELDPLPPADLEAALALWPELARLRTALLEQYGALPAGWHRFVFGGGRVVLTLAVGDARETLTQLGGQVDAWFLDGFSPAKNPQLWEAGVFEAVAAHSRSGTTFATYTSAGAVRRGLQAAGFKVEKSKGFGPKREMLRGELARATQPQARASGPREAVVVGGGLAGTAAAHSLARRGWRVLLLERHAGLAAEASGNPQGILYARLSPAQTPLSRLVLAGYQYSLRTLRALLPADGEGWSAVPVVQLAYDVQEAARQAKLLDLGWPAALLRPLGAEEASSLAGVPLATGGLVFPAGGWVHPPALCRALAEHPFIATRTGARVTSLEQSGAGWRVVADGRVLAEAPVVVLAGGADSAGYAQTRELPLRVNRGQVTMLPATAQSRRLGAVLCAESYVAPARAGLHSAGATFAREPSVEATVADNAENLAMLQRLSPALFRALDGPALAAGQLLGRAALRCVSPDYLPLVGRIGEGLYVSSAHGSRGLITAPLAGEVLCALVEEEPAPLPRALLAAVDPGRFSAQARGARHEARD
jgi:tRNA 5-methylaminomethyl-2-thiouridine biosynthesis bifunctional protein